VTPSGVDAQGRKKTRTETSANVPHTHQFQGSCHCGAIRAQLAASKPADALEVRACQCAFCRRHGAMTVSDPQGRASFEIERARLVTYQFATRTGSSLICGRCGMYAGVVLTEASESWSVLNVRGLAIAAFAGRQALPMVYDGETPAARIARRKAKWTPTELRLIE
jgi:hypothetical protein